jgi:hypothetical protein
MSSKTKREGISSISLDEETRQILKEREKVEIEKNGAFNKSAYLRKLIKNDNGK